MEFLTIISSLGMAALLGAIFKRRLVLEIASVAAAVLSAVGAIIIAVKVSLSGVYAPFPFISIDSLGAIIMLLIGCVGAVVVTYSVSYLRQETAKGIVGLTRVRQFFILQNLFIIAMFLAVASDSPVLTWISIEATTLTTALLVSYYNKASSIESAWKYLIINSVGLLLAFFGTLLYFSAIHEVDGYISWTYLLANVENLDPAIIKFAFIFILVGYGVKIGFAPMHTWLPDAHSKAPAPISALLSGVLLNVVFFAVLKFKIITDAAVGVEFSQTMLIATGLLSIFVAAMIILVQKSYKRLLAYSSVENMGIIALGFGFGGVGIVAALFHMIYHSLIKSSLFLLSGNILLHYSSAKITKVTGMLKLIPVTAVLFCVAIFTITGAPPFGIFTTKILMLTGGIQSYTVVCIVAILLFAIVFVGLFKHLSSMVFGDKPADVDEEAVEPGDRSTEPGDELVETTSRPTNLGTRRESLWLILPSMVMIAAAIYLSFHVPSFLLTLINNAAGGF